MEEMDETPGATAWARKSPLARFLGLIVSFWLT